MRALTALKQAAQTPQPTDGRAPEMPLSKIEKDPDNPRPPLHLRTPEEQEQQRELNKNVLERRVKSPISLRPHPTKPDTWIINHGHCRYDAAKAAGFATIPYFIDPNFDSYDQIAENLHRSDLSIWAIAGFIKRKLDEGQSKTEIAQRLGKDGLNYVTEHLALVDAPGCIHQAYACAVKSPRTLYDLRRAHDEFPEQVDAWCRDGGRITRDSIKELLEGLRRQVAAAEVRGLTVTEERIDRERTQAPADGSGSGLRHDVIRVQPGNAAATDHGDPKDVPGNGGSTKDAEERSAPIDRGISVRYRGRMATVTADSKIRIAIDGDETVLDVRIMDVEFVKAG